MLTKVKRGKSAEVDGVAVEFLEKGKVMIKCFSLKKKNKKQKNIYIYIYINVRTKKKIFMKEKMNNRIMHYEIGSMKSSFSRKIALVLVDDVHLPLKVLDIFAHGENAD